MSMPLESSSDKSNTSIGESPETATREITSLIQQESSPSQSHSQSQLTPRQRGQHMVDYVDTDSVDFEPLTKSIGGAATTDLDAPYNNISNINMRSRTGLDPPTPSESTSVSTSASMSSSSGNGSGSGIGNTRTQQRNYTYHRADASSPAGASYDDTNGSNSYFDIEDQGEGQQQQSNNAFNKSSSKSISMDVLNLKTKASKCLLICCNNMYHSVRRTVTMLLSIITLPMRQIKVVLHHMYIMYKKYLPSPSYSLSALTSSELSLVSSLSICATFFAIIVLSGFISSSLGYSHNDSGIVGTSSDGGISNSMTALSSNRMNGNASGGDRVISQQGVGLAPPFGTRLPPAMEDVFADVSDQPMELMDTAIFWHVPRSAGATMKSVLTTCLGKVIATDAGGLDGHHLDERLEIIRKPHGQFLNVDTTTTQGLKHAKSLGVIQSKAAAVIFTPFIQESTILFDRNHRGRFFTLLREPVDRIISLYYFRRMEKEEVREQTLDEFIQTSGENWMVRMLTGCMSGPLDVIHLDAAKEILRSKFLVGLIETKTESFRRFEEYFGWKFPSPVSQTCKNNMYYFEWHSKNPHPMPAEDDPVIQKIRNLNMWDLALYEYAKQLFEEQEALFWDKSSDQIALTWTSTAESVEKRENP